jgi:hypothetical protein
MQDAPTTAADVHGSTHTHAHSGGQPAGGSHDAPSALISSAATRAPIIGSWRAWAELLRISNLPTILGDCAVGLCIATASYSLWKGPAEAMDLLRGNPWLVGGVCMGMCMLYLGGMVMRSSDPGARSHRAGFRCVPHGQSQ